MASLLAGPDVLGSRICSYKHARVQLLVGHRSVAQQHQTTRLSITRNRPCKIPQAAAEATLETLPNLGVELPLDEAAPSVSESRESFDWAKQWYPLAVADQLDPKRPNKAQLLGKHLALWQDPEGTWRAFEDRCPHRLAPFTEGRVEEQDGLLSCSYHGWRFDGSGRVQHIPQANDEKVHQSALHSPRACVASFPTTVQQNRLWVWGESGPEAFIHSAAKQPAITAEVENMAPGQEIRYVSTPYAREVYYDFETLVENFLDPAHVPFAHHSVLGNRYKDEAGYVRTRRTEGWNVPNDGFSFDTDLKSFSPNPVTTKIQFFPPSLVRYFTPKDDGTFTAMNLHCIPVAPNRSKVIYNMLSTVDTKFTKVASKVPAWKDHLTRHLVFDGDHKLLQIQEQIAAQEIAQPGGSWRKSYWMPTESDRIVTAWRQWLDARGGPTWAPGTPRLPLGEELPKSLLLDRWDQHTKNCPRCLKALQVFKALRATAASAAIVASAAALVAAGLGVAAASSEQGGFQGGFVWSGGLFAASAGFAVLWRILTANVEKFYWVDYDHQAKQ